MTRTRTRPVTSLFVPLRLRPDRWEIGGFLGSLALFLVIALLVISQDSPLGHDEAVYATRARELLNGEQASNWWVSSRAVGLPLLLTSAWMDNGAELNLRLVVMFCGALLLLATWLMARLMIGPRGAIVAAFGMAVSPLVLMSASHVWPDVPGAAFGMTAMCVYAYGLVAKRFRWWGVTLVIALTGFATVVRYGAPIPIGIGLVGLTLWRWPVERERRASVVALALGIGTVLAVILLTPLLTGAGTPYVTIASDSVHNPLFGGFGDYWILREQVLAGSTVGALAAVAVGGIGVARNRFRRRNFLIPFSVFLSTFVALATLVHGEVRYLTPVLPWLWISAGAVLVWYFERVPKPLAVGLAVSAVILLAVFAREQADNGMELNQGFTNVKEAALTVRSDSECAVFTTLLYAPVVEWYSGCETTPIGRDGVEFVDELSYLVIVENGGDQLQGELIEQYLTRTSGAPVTVGDRHSRYPSVDIWKLSD